MKTARIGWFLLFSLLASVAASAADEVNKSLFGVAIKGYDPVAYFVNAAPRKGVVDFEYEWRGAKWRFVSEENRDFFAKSPEQYAPQFGGYCAWSVSQGSTAGIDPEAWKIVRGKLYLNSSREVHAKWEQDVPGNIRKANANWPAVLNK